MSRPQLVDPCLIRLTLVLRPGEDDDLIDWFASMPQRGRARAVICALRQGGVNLADESAEEDDQERAMKLAGALMF